MELMTAAKNLGAPYDLVLYVHKNGRLPVVNFAAGGIATPADAALMMHLGADGVFVGSGVFKAGKRTTDNPEAKATTREAGTRAKAIVKAVTHYDDPAAVAEASRGLGEAMVGISARSIGTEELLATRGW